ncbi:diaminopimelate decarboxylase family protein [Desulfoluna butyratoxydans]|nr:alanine racemase [Desulfoluna butyratoxydans]
MLTHNHLPLSKGLVSTLVNGILNERALYTDPTHPSPFYYLNRSVLSQRAKTFRKVFENHLPKTEFFYAVKSNSHPMVAKTLMNEGFGLDISSGEELKNALSWDAARIVFSGPGKTDEELKKAAWNNDRVCVLIDSFGELERLQTIAKELKVVVRAGIRLTTNPDGAWRKFGIPLDQLPAFWNRCRQLPNVYLQGLQFHTSWNLTPGSQVSFIAQLGKALADMPDSFKKRITFVDIGGGYWPEEGEWLQPDATPGGKIRLALGEATNAAMSPVHEPGTCITTFAQTLSHALRHHIFPHLTCKVCFEPGRWLVSHAMHLVVTVVDKKAEDLVITDAGTNAIGWERFETDYAPIVNLSRPGLVEQPCHVLGSLCTPHDLWGYSYWGTAIEPGDRLLIPRQGAYTYSLRQHFIKPVPTVVIS